MCLQLGKLPVTWCQCKCEGHTAGAPIFSTVLHFFRCFVFISTILWQTLYFRYFSYTILHATCRIQLECFQCEIPLNISRGKSHLKENIYISRGNLSPLRFDNPNPILPHPILAISNNIWLINHFSKWFNLIGYDKVVICRWITIFSYFHWSSEKMNIHELSIIYPSVQYGMGQQRPIFPRENSVLIQ